MDDSRDPLSDLVASAEKEIARLARVDTLDVRNELRFRIWPFLIELGETVQAALGEDVDSASAPVDAIAKAVGFMLTLVHRLGEYLPKAEMDELAGKAATMMEELMALCDPDELAAYVADDGTHSPAISTEAIDSHTDALREPEGEIIDTTLVEPADTTADRPPSTASAQS